MEGNAQPQRSRSIEGADHKVQNNSMGSVAPAQPSMHTRSTLLVQKVTLGLRHVHTLAAVTVNRALILFMYILP